MESFFLHVTRFFWLLMCVIVSFFGTFFAWIGFDTRITLMIIVFWKSLSPYLKNQIVLTWMLVRDFEKNLKGTRTLFCGRGSKCFSSLWGTNFETTHYPTLIFLFNTLKVSCQQAHIWEHMFERQRENSKGKRSVREESGDEAWRKCTNFLAASPSNVRVRTQATPNVRLLPGYP